MKQLTIDDFLPTRNEVEGTIEKQILNLFVQLTPDRQAALLVEPRQMWDLDVEESEDDDHDDDD